MQKQKHYHYAFVTVLGVALMFMTVGFVAYAQMLSSSNASALSKITPIHSVGFNVDSYLESDTSDAAKQKSITSDEINFSITLKKPGDSYGALVNVENLGNVDELVSQITMSEIPAQYADAIDYRVEFNDEYYLGTSYNVNTVISKGQANREQLFITVDYKEDAADLGEINLDLSTGLVFD